MSNPRYEVLWNTDVDDEGNAVDLEVDATLHYDDERGWYADFCRNARRWVAHKD